METSEKLTNIRTEATLENPDLSFLQPAVGAFLADYGWYLLFICLGVFLLIQEFRKRTPGRPHDSRPPENAEDVSSVVRRQEALEASRRRMQEELDAKAAQHREKKQKAEEEKRRQKIEMWDSMKGGKSYKGNAQPTESNDAASSSTVVKSKGNVKPLRSGYNPLSGEGGGSCSWRPGRRGPSSGG